MRPARIFLLKGKETMIDHVKSVNSLGCIYWRKSRNRKFAVGDICYLYLVGEGHYQVRYRLEVTSTSSARNDNFCWLTPFQPDNDCYKLVPTSAMYKGNNLSLADLEQIGIKKHVLCKELNVEQESYLREYFK